jgi:signal transduction histidine kinase
MDRVAGISTNLTGTMLLFILAVAALALIIGAVLSIRAASSQRRLTDELREARDRMRDLPEAIAARMAADARTAAASAPPIEASPASATQSAGGASAEPAQVAMNGTPSNAAIDIAPAAPPASAQTTESDHESFSFTVSHDLRAPIRVVEGFTKIVKEDYGRLLDRVGNDHLDRILAAAARMNNMIDALLELSKLSSQPLARQPVNLSQLAGYVADDLRRQWPERDVQIDIEPGMQVQGDPTLLRAVVDNLLGNAWKYTGKTAQASIAFTRDPQNTESFTVRDNGAGFDMRFADRLFGVFQRLHSANDFPGTGVGLASVRRIVRRHGGEIWGEAEVNHGARFHFSLPHTLPHAQAHQPSQSLPH